ncbi:MAG: 3'-5' exonuclease [Kiritimatiellae bacterium]|nr:3'-5' exonuclease [Kiritimatiellia bacterium]
MKICKRTLETLCRLAKSGRVVVFDTETTGGMSWDEICQISAVEYVEGRFTRSLNVYLCPTCEINPWAERVHGLSLEYLQEHGVDPEEGMRRFFDFLGNDVLLVAHNNRFDMRMVQQECVKFHLQFEPVGVETCDTLALSRHLRPDLESHKLAVLIEALGVEGVNSHNALDDAFACAGVFWKLLEQVDSGPPEQHELPLFPETAGHNAPAEKRRG